MHSESIQRIEGRGRFEDWFPIFVINFILFSITSPTQALSALHTGQERVNVTEIVTVWSLPSGIGTPTCSLTVAISPLGLSGRTSSPRGPQTWKIQSGGEFANERDQINFDCIYDRIKCFCFNSVSIKSIVIFKV